MIGGRRVCNAISSAVFIARTWEVVLFVCFDVVELYFVSVRQSGLNEQIGVCTVAREKKVWTLKAYVVCGEVSYAVDDA